MPAIASGEQKSFTSYSELRDAMFHRFLPPAAHILYRDRLANLRQKCQNAEVYVGEFMALRHKCDNMTDSEALDKFMRGLDFRLRRQLCIYPGGIPTILREARERAILLHQTMQGGYFGTPSTSNYRGFDNMNMSSHPVQNATPATTSKPDADDMMVVDNMQFRQNRIVFRGKCYECQQYGHRAVDCPNKHKGNGQGQ